MANIKTPKARAYSMDALPLFATDDMLGAALLGPDRAQEWKQMAPLLEARGLPKIDARFGGRYVPAVRAHFDREYGLDGNALLVPDGVENFESWKQKSRRS